MTCWRRLRDWQEADTWDLDWLRLLATSREDSRADAKRAENMQVLDRFLRIVGPMFMRANVGAPTACAHRR
jgi:hypothetical protein